MSAFQFTRAGVVPIDGTATAQSDLGTSDAEVSVKTKPKALSKVPERSLNVVKLARARLKQVELEIKRLNALVRERDELRRLLDAATNKPRAVVREIKAARG